MKVTIRDIAVATGLSPATISLVLNNKPSRISNQTKEIVLSTAAQMGYRPNSAAVSLKTKRTRTIGLLVPDIRNDYYSHYAKGVEAACQKNDWDVLLCSSNYNPSREKKHVNSLIARNVDGIALVSTPSRDQTVNLNNIEYILNYNIPLVQLDMSFYKSPMNVVTCDYEKGGYMATRHLLALGHKKIAFITGPSYFEGSTSRLQGCKRAFQDYHLDWNDDLIYEGNYTYESGLDGIDYLSDKNFTALFAFNDLMAFGVYNGLAKYGLSVPDDISVIGFDDHFTSSILNIPLTTVRQPIYEMGLETVRILIEAAENPTCQPIISRFDSKLIVRKSTKSIRKEKLAL